MGDDRDDVKATVQRSADPYRWLWSLDRNLSGEYPASGTTRWRWWARLRARAAVRRERRRRAWLADRTRETIR